MHHAGKQLTRCRPFLDPHLTAKLPGNSLAQRAINDPWNPHLYDSGFLREIFFIPAGTNRLAASLMDSSLLKRCAQDIRKIGLDSKYPL
jgi:hypothetical protein